VVRRLIETTRGSRTTLFLYGLLVLLPAGVFGGLLWHQLAQQHEHRVNEVPRVVRDAAGRLLQAIEHEVALLLEKENSRDFYFYRQDYFEQSTVPGESGLLDLRARPSPLANEPPRPGIRAWFEWDMAGLSDMAPKILVPTPRGLTSKQQAEHVRWRQNFERFVEKDLIVSAAQEAHFFEDQRSARAMRNAETARPKMMNIELVALNCSPERDRRCVYEHRGQLRERLGGLNQIAVTYGPFELKALRDHSGELRIVAQRQVVIDALPEQIQVPSCYIALERIQLLMQGFEFDPQWLLRTLPEAEAARILGPGFSFYPVGPKVDPSPGEELAAVDLWDELEIEVVDRGDRDMATLHVSSSVAGLNRAWRVQLFWLLGVTVAMVASLGIGLRLLVGSVRASQAQTRRTENFVAAITHELRTPIAAVKMYGEMLRDGWARDEQRRGEYLNRIVHESDRLADLVDKVLAQRMLSGHAPLPVPGDLSALISHMVADLTVSGGRKREDLEFVLGRGLPPVLLYREGVREILVNLVENARKYAPVPTGGEPIRVETRLDRRGRVLLEVSDRGPGIPETERSRVFRPFYRLGDERTRRAQGTGLGLHLVQLQARAMKAKVLSMPREGGGTVFRITFRTLRPGTLV
jgi:signal transduction histidine kinase